MNRVPPRLLVRLRTVFLAVGLLVALTGPAQGAHAPGHPNADQGLTDAGEEQAFARARELLLQESQAPNVDTIFTVREQPAPRGGCPLTGRVYWGYARRGTICFTRQPAGEGWSFDVRVVEGVNPIAAQDRGTLHTLDEERGAAFATEGTGGDFRALVGDQAITYPFAYERVVAELDSPRAGDFIVMPHHLADKGDQKGAHGHLGQVQTRSTFLIAGRGARTAPIDPGDELDLGVQHVDVAPTVAEALGVNPYFEDTGESARTLNGQPSNTALMERQDGQVLDDLLEPVFNTIVVVVDGLHPDQFTNATQMPNLNALIAETCSDPGCPHATVYQQARAVMTTETGPNHAAMMTGGYVEQHGLPGDDLFNRATGELETSEGRPELVMAETLFDRIETEAPWLETAAVVGKTTLRGMFDCTRDAEGNCGTSSANPEGIPVTHVAPDILAGAAEPQDVDPQGYDCPAENASGTGYAEDVCIMDTTLDVLSTEDPDFTLVNLALTDGFQHLHGRGSPDHLAAVADADEQIGRLVEYLQESGKWQHASVIVTADHNFASATAGLPTNRILLDGVFGTVTDPEPFEVVTTGGYASVYLTEADPDALTAEEQQTLADLRAAAVATTGITEALYRVPNPEDGNAAHTLDTVHPNWNVSCAPDRRAGAHGRRGPQHGGHPRGPPERADRRARPAHRPARAVRGPLRRDLRPGRLGGAVRDGERTGRHRRPVRTGRAGGHRPHDLLAPRRGAAGREPGPSAERPNRRVRQASGRGTRGRRHHRAHRQPCRDLHLRPEQLGDSELPGARGHVRRGRPVAGGPQRSQPGSRPSRGWLGTGP